MNLKQALKITLLIIILVEEIKSVKKPRYNYDSEKGKWKRKLNRKITMLP